MTLPNQIYDDNNTTEYLKKKTNSHMAFLFNQVKQRNLFQTCVYWYSLLSLTGFHIESMFSTCLDVSVDYKKVKVVFI